MPSLQSFSSWLSRATAAQLTSVLTRRRDLLRADAPTISAIAGAAGTRAGVLRALEAAAADALQLLHAMAVRARIGPIVKTADLPSPPQPGPLQELIDLGLVWPARAQDSPAPLQAGQWRVQAEVIGLLPTTAAQLESPPAWLTAAPPPQPQLLPLPPAIVANAQAGAASQVVSDLVSIVRTVQESPASQLVKGGIGKRDVSAYSARTKTPAERTVLLLELAGGLGLLGVGGMDSDPVWLPTTEFAPFANTPRAQAYGRALEAWLRMPVEVGVLLAGRDSAGGTVHVLADLAAGAVPFPDRLGTRPVMPLARYLLLAELERLGAVDGHALPSGQFAGAMSWRHPLLPATADEVVRRLLREAEYLGLVCTPLGAPDSFGLTGVGAQLARHLRAAMPAETAPLPFSERSLSVPGELTDAVADMLPPLLHTVIVQSDLTAVATGPLDPGVATRLDRIADVENRGQGTVYRFTESSVRRGLESGLSAADVLDIIAQTSGLPPVQPLRYLVTEVADRMHRVRIAPARSVIVVDDPADLAGLAADPLLLAAGIEVLGPTVATASVSHERLASLLAAAGVHTVGGAQAERRPSVAPVTRAQPVAHRSLRVADADLDRFVAALVSSRSGENRAPAASADASAPQSVAASLQEAAAAGNTVVLEAVSSTGAVRSLRVRPTAVGSGRMRGVRAGRSDGTEVSLPIARIRAVREDPLDASGPTTGPRHDSEGEEGGGDQAGGRGTERKGRR